MEKKVTRGLPATRSTATDSKKDGINNGKQWPRGTRRRESSGGNLPSKGEPSRKPQPQRAKPFDKRPKPRGCPPPPVARNEAAALGEREAELGSVFLPGSKKQSLNHLLNFSYAARDGRCAAWEGGDGEGNRMLRTRKHKYNKEHFLQANCQFIVNESGDYKPYLNNPDVLVDWSLIEQVIVQVSEYPSCPICLYPPVAAKMTRCGHIYCWSCVLHYLSVAEKTSSRHCPICYEPLHERDLKSVMAIPHATFNVNETITFKLMKRPRGGLIAYPDEYEIKGDNALFRVSEKEAQDVYSKLLLANNADIMSIIDRERRELQRQLEEDEDSSERCFVEQAKLALKTREDAVLANLAGAAPSNVDDATGVEALKRLKIRNDPVIGNANEAGVTRYHYFYQASDGQHIYINAINARMLEHTYGSLEFGPKTLSGKILEKEGGSMTEELRKRLTHLQHLPVTCQFEVAEIQLKSPIVNKDTLDYFQEQLEKRRKKRHRRAKEEKRREKRIEMEEDKLLGKYPDPNIHLNSNDQFPEFLGEARFRTESENTLRERSQSPDAGTSPEYAGPSFATMLAKAKKQSPTWPVLTGAASASESPKFINVTGSKMAAVTPVRAASDSDAELEGYEPVPSFNASFGDVLARALQQQEGKSEEQGNQAVGRKKKKSKQTVLFTTNRAFTGN